MNDSIAVLAQTAQEQQHKLIGLLPEGLCQAAVGQRSLIVVAAPGWSPATDAVPLFDMGDQCAWLVTAEPTLLTTWLAHPHVLAIQAEEMPDVRLMTEIPPSGN